jgi:excisionase family DNA binding protein
MREPLASAADTAALDEILGTSIDDFVSNIPVKKPRTISVEEAGRILGISRMAAYQAVWRGQIPSIRIGRRLLVPLAKLNEMAPPVEDDERREADDQPLSAACRSKAERC